MRKRKTFRIDPYISAYIDNSFFEIKEKSVRFPSKKAKMDILLRLVFGLNMGRVNSFWTTCLVLEKDRQKI